MTEAELQDIKGRIREHTGLVYRADLATLLSAAEENVRLTDENIALRGQIETAARELESSWENENRTAADLLDDRI